MKQSISPFANDQRSTDELIRVATSNFESDEAWKAIAVLQDRATRKVFEKAADLLHNAEPTHREVGVHILGQLGGTDVAFRDESVPLLIACLHDPSDAVVAAAATALGYRGDSRCIPHLLALVAHPSADVRLGVGVGLGLYDDERATDGLITLSQDNDADVRNWATFGLGSQIDKDSPSIRAALWQRVTDEVPEIRGEALLGLAKRRDKRIGEAIIRELNGEFYGTWPVEAAGLLGDPTFYPHLIALRQRVRGTVEGRFIECIDKSIQKCTPPDLAKSRR